MRIATVAACMSITCSAYAAIPCQTVKDGNGHWSWREVDGRRCWYRGSPGKPKTQLFWQVAAKPASAPQPRPEPRTEPRPEPQALATSPVLYLQVTRTTPAPPADMLRAQPMTDGVLVETPGAVIRDAAPAEPELPFAERWSGLRHAP